MCKMIIIINVEVSTMEKKQDVDTGSHRGLLS